MKGGGQETPMKCNKSSKIYEEGLIFDNWDGLQKYYLISSLSIHKEYVFSNYDLQVYSKTSNFVHQNVKTISTKICISIFCHWIKIFTLGRPMIILNRFWSKRIHFTYLFRTIQYFRKSNKYILHNNVFTICIVDTSSVLVQLLNFYCDLVHYSSFASSILISS